MNTKTQLSAWSKGLLEAALLAVVTAAPLVVNYQGFRAFELPKAAVVLTFALLTAAVGVIALLEGGDGTRTGVRAALREGVVRAALAVVAIEGIATVLSIVPSVSFFGSPERAQGWLSLLACAVLFVATAAVARAPERRARLVATMIAASVPVAVYALAQAARLEVVPGTVESAQRVFGTLSNPIFLGAYLMLLVPLTLWRLGAALTGGRPLVAGAYTLVALLQLSALALTGSRGPLVGLLAALVILGLGWAAAAGRRRAVVWAVGVGAALTVFVGVLAMPGTPLAGLRDAPVIGRLAQIGESGTGSQAVRLGIWRAAAATMAAAADPEAETAPLVAQVELKRGRVLKWLVGHGPEMQRYVLLPFGDTYMGGRAQADRLVDRAHDVPFDVLLTAGLPGLAARLWLWAAWLATCVGLLGLASERRDRTVLAALLGAGALAGAVAWFAAPAFAGPVAALGLAVGLGLFVAWAGLRRRGDDAGPVNGAALALLAAGTAAVVEAAFGIETVVTQLIFWVLAGLVVALTLGDVAEPAAAAATAGRRAAGRTAASGDRGHDRGAGAEIRVGLRWSPGGAALGLIAAGAMSVALYDLLLPGAVPLTHTRLVLGLLIAAGFGAMLLAVVDTRESVGAYVLFALTLTALFTFLRSLIVLGAGPTAAYPVRIVPTTLWLVLILWLIVLAIGAGIFLRAASSERAPFWIGPPGITYPIAGVGAVVVIMLLAIQPVQGDLLFQAGYDDFRIALSGDQEQRFQSGTQRFNQAVALQRRDDIMFLKWSELYAQLGEVAGQTGQAETLATAMNTAQNLLGRAEAINPAMIFHVFNRGHVQLLAAQLMGASGDPATASVAMAAAQNAELALQQSFDILSYDPQVANELATAKLLQGKLPEGLALLEYSRDTLDPDNPSTYGLLSEAYKRSGDTAKADEALKRAAELGGAGAGGAGGDASILLREGDEAREAGDLSTAIVRYEKAIEILGQRVDWRVLYNLGQLHRESGNTQSAVQALQGAMQLAPPEAQEQVQQALIDALQGTGTGPPPEFGQPMEPSERPTVVP